MFTKKVSLILVCLLFFSFPYNAKSDSLLGITWSSTGNPGRMVTFDPNAGVITQEHGITTPTIPNQDFTGLTYDPIHNKIYALSQVQNNLYSIDPLTLNTTLVGQLNIGGTKTWYDANALAFDPMTNSLYTVTQKWDAGYVNNRGTFSSINVNTGELTPISNVSGLIKSLSFNPQDGNLYGLSLDGWGSWDSPYKTKVIKINPATGSITQLFETPYHTMMGFAQKPNTDQYYSWVNWTSHYYGLTDISNQSVTSLGSDNVGVISAMTYQDFFVAPAYEELVTQGQSFEFKKTLGETFTFDYWWYMQNGPPPYQQGNMFDVLALQGGAGWQYIGQVDAYGNSTGWQTAMFQVPSNLIGQEVELRFVLNDYYPETNPIVYLNNVSSVPEPATMLLLGSGLIGLFGLRRKFKK